MPDDPSSAISRAHAAVRARFAQALARRAEAHAGPARRVLDEKLAALKDELAAPCGPADDRVAPPPRRGLLAELVAEVSRDKAAPVLARATLPREAAADRPPAHSGEAVRDALHDCWGPVGRLSSIVLEHRQSATSRRW